MSTLDTMIRLQRWQLDERRTQLGELERLAARLKGETERLVHELAAEQRVAAADPEAGAAYASYAAAILERRKKLEASIAEVEEQIERARESLAEAFREMKRYELAAANRKSRERAQVMRRQQIIQDEVALQIYRRRET